MRRLLGNKESWEAAEGVCPMGVSLNLSSVLKWNSTGSVGGLGLRGCSDDELWLPVAQRFLKDLYDFFDNAFCLSASFLICSIFNKSDWSLVMSFDLMERREREGRESESLSLSASVSVSVCLCLSVSLSPPTHLPVLLVCGFNIDWIDAVALRAALLSDDLQYTHTIIIMINYNTCI